MSATTTTESTESTVHPPRAEMSVPYAVIKVFSDFGYLAGKPLAPSAVEELTRFWGRIQQSVASGGHSVAVVRRCVAGAAREARALSLDEPRIGGHHVREAVDLVRARATGTAGVLCRVP